MQAIQTKYHGPSNVRGSRIIARASAGSVIVGYDHRLDIEENHKAAAHALAVKLDWLSDAYGSLVCGSLPDGSYAHVFTLSVEP